MSLNTITSRGKLTKSGTRSVTKEKVGRKNKSKGGGKTTPMSMTRTMLGEMWRKLETTFRSTRSKLKKTMTKRTTSVSLSMMTLMMSNFISKSSQRSSSGISTITIRSNPKTILTKEIIVATSMIKIKGGEIISKLSHVPPTRINFRWKVMTLTKSKLRNMTLMEVPTQMRIINKIKTGLKFSR